MVRKKGSENEAESQFKFESSVTWLYVLMTIIVVIGSAANGYTMFYPKWREAGPIVYSYKYRNSRLNHQVGTVTYGLYKLDYDDSGAIQTWDTRVQIAKVKAMSAAEIGQNPAPGQMLNLWSSMCPPTCQESVIFRARIYDEMRADCTIVLAVMGVASAIAIAGVLWYIIVEKNLLVQIGCWISAPIIQAVASVYWLYQSDSGWTQISSKQQVPYPSLSICWYVNLGVIFIFLIAALGTYIAFVIDANAEKRQKNLIMAQQNFGNHPGNVSWQDPNFMMMGRTGNTQYPPNGPWSSIGNSPVNSMAWQNNYMNPMQSPGGPNMMMGNSPNPLLQNPYSLMSQQQGNNAWGQQIPQGGESNYSYRMPGRSI